MDEPAANRAPRIMNPETQLFAQKPETQQQRNIEASIIRIGFWGPLNYNSNKEPPKKVLVSI